MAELLPAGIRDDRFRALEQVAEARFGDLDLTRLLVMIIDQVDASALPALAWQFGVLRESWQAAATDAERRALLHRVLARRRRRGTPWAVLDALAAIGHTDAFIQEDTELLYDGSIAYDGLFTYSDGSPFRFWVVLNAEAPTLADDDAIRALVGEWKRLSAWCDAVYRVSGTPSADFFDRIVAIWPLVNITSEDDEVLTGDDDVELLSA